jgi:hypothetical protein
MDGNRVGQFSNDSTGVYPTTRASHERAAPVDECRRKRERRVVEAPLSNGT